MQYNQNRLIITSSKRKGVIRMKEWITISITPPKVGVPIVLRTANSFGLGRGYEVSDVDEELFSQEEYETSLVGTDFVEWMDIS